MPEFIYKRVAKPYVTFILALNVFPFADPLYAHMCRGTCMR